MQIVVELLILICTVSFYCIWFRSFFFFQFSVSKFNLYKLCKLVALYPTSFYSVSGFFLNCLLIGWELRTIFTKDRVRSWSNYRYFVFVTTVSNYVLLLNFKFFFFARIRIFYYVEENFIIVVQR